MKSEMKDFDVTFNTHETRTEDGKRMAIWTLDPSDGAQHVLPVVVGAGFARRMDHLSAVAQYCAYNGFRVTRYDPVNHVGLSEGQMEDFTMSESLRSLRAAVDWTCEHTGQPQVAIVATSLTARIAFELAAQSDRVAVVVTAVGVVNLKRTLHCVFEVDYETMVPEEIEGWAVFEGKKITPTPFARDAHEHRWWYVDECIEKLKRVKQPLINFVGSADEWVDRDEVIKVFDEGTNGPRKLYTLDRAPHDLSRDPAVARTFLLRCIEELFTFQGLQAPVVEPPFEALSRQTLLERRTQFGGDRPKSSRLKTGHQSA